MPRHLKKLPAETAVPELAEKARKISAVECKKWIENPLPVMMVRGVAQNGMTAARGYSKMFGKLDILKSIDALASEIRKVRDGDLSGLEATLTAQTVTLNAMFTQLA